MCIIMNTLLRLEGGDAHRNGFSRLSNPYHGEADASFAWATGWDASDAASELRAMEHYLLDSSRKRGTGASLPPATRPT